MYDDTQNNINKKHNFNVFVYASYKVVGCTETPVFLRKTTSPHTRPATLKLINFHV